MKVNEATALAKKYVLEASPGGAVPPLRMENFLYDDHLAVWTITLASPDIGEPKVVRISNMDGSLLSIG